MRESQGLTLIELMLCLSLLATLSMLSLPNFEHIVQKYRSDLVMRSVMDALTLARTTAISTNTLMTLCKSSDGLECGGQWHDGMLLFTDSNGDRTVNQDDVVRHYFTFPGSEGTLHWRAFQNRQYLQFTPQGFTRYQNGNFTYCPENLKPQLARQLILNRTARARFALDSDGDGVREDSNGKPLVCD